MMQTVFVVQLMLIVFLTAGMVTTRRYVSRYAVGALLLIVGRWAFWQAALTFEGDGGHDLSQLINNDWVRFFINLAAILVLLIEMVRGCLRARMITAKRRQQVAMRMSLNNEYGEVRNVLPDKIKLDLAQALKDYAYALLTRRIPVSVEAVGVALFALLFATAGVLLNLPPWVVALLPVIGAGLGDYVTSLVHKSRADREEEKRKAAEEQVLNFIASGGKFQLESRGGPDAYPTT